MLLILLLLLELICVEKQTILESNFPCFFLLLYLVPCVVCSDRCSFVVENEMRCLLAENDMERKRAS